MRSPTSRLRATAVILLGAALVALCSCARAPQDWTDHFNDNPRGVEWADGALVASITAPGGSTIMRLSSDTGSSLWSSYIADSKVTEMHVDGNTVTAVESASTGPLLTTLSLDDGRVTSQVRLIDNKFAGFVNRSIVQFNEQELLVSERSGLAGTGGTWAPPAGCVINGAVVFGERIAVITQCGALYSLVIISGDSLETASSIEMPTTDAPGIREQGGLLVVSRDVDFLVFDESGQMLVQELGTPISVSAADGQFFVAARQGAGVTLTRMSPNSGPTWSIDLPPDVDDVATLDDRIVVSEPDPNLRWGTLLTIHSLKDGSVDLALTESLRGSIADVMPGAVIVMGANTIVKVTVPRTMAPASAPDAGDLLSVSDVEKLLGGDEYAEHVDGRPSPAEALLGRSRVTYVPHDPAGPILSVTMITGSAVQATSLLESLPDQWNGGSVGRESTRVGQESDPVETRQALVHGDKGLVLVDLSQSSDSQFTAVVTMMERVLSDGK